MKISKLQKVGDSKGVILPAQILKFLGIEDAVEISIKEDCILIKKVEKLKREA